MLKSLNDRTRTLMFFTKCVDIDHIKALQKQNLKRVDLVLNLTHFQKYTSKFIIFQSALYNVRSVCCKKLLKTDSTSLKKNVA